MIKILFRPFVSLSKVTFFELPIYSESFWFLEQIFWIKVCTYITQLSGKRQIIEIWLTIHIVMLKIPILCIGNLYVIRVTCLIRSLGNFRLLRYFICRWVKSISLFYVPTSKFRPVACSPPQVKCCHLRASPAQTIPW